MKPTNETIFYRFDTGTNSTRSFPHGKKAGSKSQDMSSRLQVLTLRLLNVEIYMGSKAASLTVNQVLNDPVARQQLCERIRKRLTKKANVLSNEISNRYQSVMNLPAVKMSLEFQQKHLTLKVITYALKIINAIAKAKVIPHSNNFKEIYSLIKLVKKAVGFKDTTNFYKNLDEVWNSPTKIYPLLKSTCSCTSLIVSTFETLSDNPYFSAVYVAAGLGADFDPVPETVTAFCEVLAPPLACFKVVTTGYGTYNAFCKWYEVDENETHDDRVFKDLKLAKYSIQCFSVAVKLTAAVFAATMFCSAAAPYLAGTLIACALVSAGLGLVSTYYNKKPMKEPLSELVVFEPGKKSEPVINPAELIHVDLTELMLKDAPPAA